MLAFSLILRVNKKLLIIHICILGVKNRKLKMSVSAQQRAPPHRGEREALFSERYVMKHDETVTAEASVGEKLFAAVS